ncbi:hypothetical protein [Gilliamella mensalis]|uniref:hypothetical protein n=1 Tax=Gilliamella mensalis TaxID=1908520 RepID=UPI001FC8ED89|nr:hypothetical protein [Gilliamella mensalis]
MVLESIGVFNDGKKAQAHLEANDKKELISTPAKNVDLTLVQSVNDYLYNKDGHHIISNASCTKNCLAPLVKVLHENFGIKSGFMTPELKGKLLGGISTCPCNCRSMIDLTLNLDKKVTV